jgi:hypothetical protein
VRENAATADPMGHIERKPKTIPLPRGRDAPPRPAPVEAATSGTRLRAHQAMAVDEKKHAERIGSLEGCPVLAISPEELVRRNIDHRAGFLLSRVDGQSSVEDILDVCAMPRTDALRILGDLIEDGIVWIVTDR